MTSAGQPAVPDDEQELRTQIQRTREQLGQTVEQFAAKADIKGMAKAKAVELTGQVRGLTQRPVPVAVAVGALLAVCLGLLWWKKR